MSYYRNNVINSPGFYPYGNDNTSFPYMEHYTNQYMQGSAMDMTFNQDNQMAIPPLPNPGEGGPIAPLPNPGEGGPVAPGYPEDNIPVIPLPNPGEGGPVAPGYPEDNIPVIPLPNPGEGGPAAPGEDIPVIPLPNPGEGGPVAPGYPEDNIPVIPLPNPGEGGPAAPGPGYPGIPGTIITVYPRPVVPCFYCVSNDSRFGRIRFLNTAFDYNPFVIFINNQVAVDQLGYAEISQYGRVTTGYQTITVAGTNGYVFIQKAMFINPNSTMTVAITNTATGLDIVEINDVPCYTPFNTSCFRACNLSYNSGPLDVTLSNNYVIFSNINYTQVTPFSRIQPGDYQFNVKKTRSNQVLVSSLVNIQPNSLYTFYMFNWNSSPDAIRTLVVEDRK